MAARISVDGHQLNVSGPAFQKAMQKCQKYQPQGPPISGAQLARFRQGALKMAECMRTHGVPNFPDPQVATGPGGHGIGIRIGAKAAGGSGGLNPQLARVPGGAEDLHAADWRAERNPNEEGR